MADMTKQQIWIVQHKLNENQRRYVLPRYESRKKSKVVAYLLWFFFAFYYFYVGKPVRNILLWLLFTILIGFVWWFVDLFYIGGMVDDYNDKLLMELVKDSRVVMNDTYEE